MLKIVLRVYDFQFNLLNGIWFHLTSRVEYIFGKQSSNLNLWDTEIRKISKKLVKASRYNSWKSQSDEQTVKRRFLWPARWTVHVAHMHETANALYLLIWKLISETFHSRSNLWPVRGHHIPKSLLRVESVQ